MRNCFSPVIGGGEASDYVRLGLKEGTRIHERG
jgi:hypothetical protein